MEKQTEVAGVEFNPPTATVSGADINDKLAAAQAAMAGPERLAKQEEANKKDGARKEQSELEKKISLLDQQKSALELEWITLDDKRKELNTKLTPLLTDEKALEEEEAKNELEEARAAAPADKQLAENKRWATQTKRRAIEEKKWGFQTELTQVEGKIEVSTQKYRTLLDEEDGIKTRLDALKNILG